MSESHNYLYSRVPCRGKRYKDVEHIPEVYCTSERGRYSPSARHRYPVVSLEQNQLNSELTSVRGGTYQLEVIRGAVSYANGFRVLVSLQVVQLDLLKFLGGQYVIANLD
jgi:hypothetical protein